jgi:hypothetical protein
MCLHDVVMSVCCSFADWDDYPIPHLNGTIPGGSKRKEANGGGGGKKRKKGGSMVDSPAVLSTDEHQARQSRAKRFEAHLQASSNVSTNVRHTAIHSVRCNAAACPN